MSDITHSNPIPNPRRPGLADRRQKSGLEKAYWEAVAARRAAGENVTLPGEFTEGNFPGPRAGFAFSMEDDEEEDPDKPMFEKFILEDGTFDRKCCPFILTFASYTPENLRLILFT